MARYGNPIGWESANHEVGPMPLRRTISYEIRISRIVLVNPLSDGKNEIHRSSHLSLVLNSLT